MTLEDFGQVGPNVVQVHHILDGTFIGDSFGLLDEDQQLVAHDGIARYCV